MRLTFSWPISALEASSRIARKYLFATSLFGIALCVIPSSVTAKQPVGGPDYLAIVPPDWKLLSEDAISHERRFVSPSGDAWLSLYASPPEESIEAHLERVRHHDHERITYERRGANWIVVSGYIGFFTVKLCSPAAASLGTTWRLNILRIKRKFSINSLRARHMLSVHIAGPAVRNSQLGRVALGRG